VRRATPAALNKLSQLTGLTQLCVDHLIGLSPGSAPLQLPGLQHLKVFYADNGTMPMSFLASCPPLRLLKLCAIRLSPGSLVASTMLQHLQLYNCGVSAADGAVDPASWQQVFSGPGQLPHLTYLALTCPDPSLEHTDIECVVACCSRLQVLLLDTLPEDSASALARLPGLTSLVLADASDQQCSSLAQLTGLRELSVGDARGVFAAGLQQLVALEQLTSLKLGSLGWSSGVLREHMSDGPPGLGLSVIINKVCEVGVGSSVCFGGMG